MGIVDECKTRAGDIATQICPGAKLLVTKEWGSEGRAAAVYGARVAMAEGGSTDYKVVIIWSYTSPDEVVVGINGGRYHKGIKIDRLLHTNGGRDGYFVFDDTEPFECFVFDLAGQHIGYVFRVKDVPVISPEQATGALAGNAVLGNDGSEVNAEHDFSTKTAAEVHSMDAGRYAKWYRTYVHKAVASFKQEVEETYEITGSYDFWEYTREARGSKELPEDYRARFPLVIYLAFIEEDGSTRIVWRLTHSDKPFSCLRYDAGGRKNMLFESLKAAGEFLDMNETPFRNYIFSFDEGEHTWSADTTIIQGLDRAAIQDEEEESRQIAELAKRYVDQDKETLLVEHWRAEFSKHFGPEEVEEKVRDALHKYRVDKTRPT